MKRYLKKYKKNIIFFLPSIEGGGVETNFNNYLNDRSINKIFNIKILTNDEEKLSKKFKNKLVKKKFFFKTKNRTLKIVLSFFNLLFLPKNYTILSFQANLYAIIAAKIKNYKIVIRLNTSTEKYIKNSFLNFFFKIFYSLADQLIVNSIDFKKEIKKNFNLNAEYVNNLIDYKSIILKSKIKVGINYFSNFKGIKLVSVGRLVDQKNHILAIRAIKKIKKKINLKLIILGSGIMKDYLKNYIIMNNLEENVLIKDFKKNPYYIINQSDFLLLTSKYEGMPNILLESGILEKPIISSNCPTGPRELKKLSPKSINLFKNNNINSLIKSLLNLKKVKKEDLNKFKKHIVENYGNSKRLEKILKYK